MEQYWKKWISYGDLSLENVIIKEKNIKFIDLSENFVSSYKLDISKLIFDIISSWSFRNTPLSLDYLKIYSLKIYLLKILATKLSRNDTRRYKNVNYSRFFKSHLYTKRKWNSTFGK